MIKGIVAGDRKKTITLYFKTFSRFLATLKKILRSKKVTGLIENVGIHLNVSYFDATTSAFTSFFMQVRIRWKIIKSLNFGQSCQFKKKRSKEEMRKQKAGTRVKTF